MDMTLLVQHCLKASSEKHDDRMVLTNFQGSLGEFIEQLAITHDLDYEFMDGVILLKEGIRYMVTMPQNPELMQRIPSAMTALGASNVKVDVDSGLVTYEAPASVRPDVDMYLERMASNSSMVALQIAVIDLRLNRDAGTGFDWNEFTTKWGTGLNNTGTATNGNLGAGNAATTTVPGAIASRALGSVMSLSGGGFGLKIDEAKFSLVAAIKLLSKYGKAQTNQDVLVSTLSGAPVKISSGTQIPYVSGVGAVTAAGGAVSGSVNTSTVNSGLKIDIIPRYDASEHLVVTLEGFWDSYLKVGRCAIEPSHTEDFMQTRFHEYETGRECLWCGHQQRKVVTPRIVHETSWVGLAC